MPNITVSVVNKVATAQGGPVIICGNSDYTITFEFDSEWSSVTTKTARFVFTRAGAVLYTDVVFTGSSANAPVLTDISEVYIGVYAGDLRTTTPAKVPCSKSILCGTGTQADPPQSVYNQIIALINAANFASPDHKHSAADITSGALKLTRGGTGSQTDIANAPGNAIIKKLKSDTHEQLYYIKSQSGALYSTGDDESPIFGPLPIAQGGFGGTTAAQALKNIGAAPDGFGLGKVCYGYTGTFFTDASALDTLTTNGFWAYNNADTPLAEADANTKYVYGINLVYSIYNVVQIGFCCDTATKIVRQMRSGVWSSWRFENPPMAVGVEYPTTERSRAGAVVYRKRITYTNAEAFGSMGTATNLAIPHGIENFGVSLRCTAKAASYLLPHIGTSGHITGVIGVDTANINVRTLNAWSANLTWDFDVAYTKTS